MLKAKTIVVLSGRSFSGGAAWAALARPSARLKTRARPSHACGQRRVMEVSRKGNAKERPRGVWPEFASSYRYPARPARVSGGVGHVSNVPRRAGTVRPDQAERGTLKTCPT